MQYHGGECPYNIDGCLRSTQPHGVMECRPDCKGSECSTSNSKQESEPKKRKGGKGNKRSSTSKAAEQPLGCQVRLFVYSSNLVLGCKVYLLVASILQIRLEA